MKVDRYLSLILAVISVVVFSCSYQPLPQDAPLTFIDLYTPQKMEEILGAFLDQNGSIAVVAKNGVFKIDQDEITALEALEEPIEAFWIENDSIIIKSQKEFYWAKSVRGTKVELVFLPNTPSLSKPSFRPRQFYETDEWTIEACCRGEWGGSVTFTNKKNQRQYTTQATCLAKLEVSDGAFYLYNYLPHLSGFTSVIQLKDIESLYEWNDSMQCNWYYELYSPNYTNFDSVRQTILGNTLENKILFDSVGIQLLYGYLDQGKPHIIYSDNENLFSTPLDDGASLEPSILTPREDKSWIDYRLEPFDSERKTLIHVTSYTRQDDEKITGDQFVICHDRTTNKLVVYKISK